MFLVLDILKYFSTKIINGRDTIKLDYSTETIMITNNVVSINKMVLFNENHCTGCIPTKVSIKKTV